MKQGVDSRRAETNQYSLVKAMIAAAKRFSDHTVVFRGLSFCTLRQLLREGYNVMRRGKGGTSFLLISW